MHLTSHTNQFIITNSEYNVWCVLFFCRVLHDKCLFAQVAKLREVSGILIHKEHSIKVITKGKKMAWVATFSPTSSILNTWG